MKNGNLYFADHANLTFEQFRSSNFFFSDKETIQKYENIIFLKIFRYNKNYYIIALYKSRVILIGLCRRFSDKENYFKLDFFE